MVKFTDKFFAFPIKIYDGASLSQAMEAEETLNMRLEADWISGVCRVPAADMETVIYQDGYSNGRTIEQVKEEGFDLTVVYLDRYGEFICTWGRKKFEEKLNEFMARQPQERENNLTL